MVELIVAVSFAVVISGMCSLFEAVLYSVPISHVESLAEDGHRSGKILRGTMQKIADNEECTVPATIDDPAVLDEIAKLLEGIGYGKGRA